MIKKIITIPVLFVIGYLGIVACGAFELIRLPFTIFMEK
jgi:hypothetical protein